MKTALALILLAAGCKAPKAPEAAAPAAAPAQPNAAEKYVGGLQNDVKLAQEAKDKADAANKKLDDSQKALRQAEGQ